MLDTTPHPHTAGFPFDRTLPPAWFPGAYLVQDIGFPWDLPQLAPLTTLAVEEVRALPYEEALCGAPDKPNCTRTARSTCCMSRAETLPMRLISRILLTVVS